MSKLKESRQRFADVEHELTLVAKQIEAVGSAALRGKRAMSDVERKELLALTERRDGLRDDLAEAKAARDKAEYENELDRRGEPIDDPDAKVAAEAARAAGIPVSLAAGFSGNDRRGGVLGAQLSHRALFGAMTANTDGWKDPGEIFRTLGAGLNDHRLRAAGQGGNSESLGGYALPIATEIALFDGMVPASIFLPRANVRPMKTRQQDVATFDRSNDGANGSMFGFTLEFLAEGGAGADVQTSTLRLISMTAHTAGILFDCSNEQLSDAPGFESGLLAAVSTAAGYGIDRVCLFGTGAGQPLGVRNQPALISVSKEVAQTNDTIVYDNLTKMFARSSSPQSSFWLASPSTIPQLSTLTIPIGTAGSHVPVMSQSNGQFSILTRPVLFSDLARPIGDAGDISLLDLSQYTIGMRAGMSLERSMHVGFTTNRLTFRLLLRFDGNSGWDQPYQPEFNAPTQSPFVQLEAR